MRLQVEVGVVRVRDRLVDEEARGAVARPVGVALRAGGRSVSICDAPSGGRLGGHTR